MSLASLSASQHLWVRPGFHGAVFCFLCLLRAEDRQVDVSSHLPALFCPHSPSIPQEGLICGCLAPWRRIHSGGQGYLLSEQSRAGFAA